MMKFASMLLVALASGVNAGRPLTASLDIIAFNDVYEMNQDNVNGINLGGPSRVVPLVQDMRAQNPNSLVIFSGDTMSPSLWSSQFKGMQMVEAHNAIGVDFACLGNHEFDFGIDAFLNVSQASKFPWLNANCYEIETNQLLRGTVPNAVKNFDNIKVGAFGVMYDMKDSSKGLRWTDPLEAAKEQVKYLREVEKVDFVIALTHQNYADDDRFSKELKGVDIIYGGHDHTLMMQTTLGAPYLKADLDFRSVWKSHIDYYAAVDKLPAVSRMSHQAIAITEEMKTDAKLDAVIATYDTQIQQLHNRTVGTLCEPLDLQSKTVRAMDAPIGNIFADAQLIFYGIGSADIAIANGGGIRTDTVFTAGPISLGQVISWSPFGNVIIILQTDGATVKKYITSEMSTSCGSGDVVVLNGFYVHPAGVKYKFRCTGLNTGEITSIEWFKHPSKTGPLLDTDVVKLALNDYLYKTRWLNIGLKAKVLVSDAEATRIDAALEKFISNQPGRTICYVKEGRSLVFFGDDPYPPSSSPSSPIPSPSIVTPAPSNPAFAPQPCPTSKPLPPTPSSSPVPSPTSSEPCPTSKPLPPTEAPTPSNSDDNPILDPTGAPATSDSDDYRISDPSDASTPSDSDDYAPTPSDSDEFTATVPGIFPNPDQVTPTPTPSPCPVIPGWSSTSTSIQPATISTPCPELPTPPSTSCMDVSVEGDATYCVEGPICSGAGDAPAGINCPPKGAIAVGGCVKNVKSYTDADKCVLPVDAICKRVKSGAWGCALSD